MRLATKGGTTTAALAAVSATELDATVDVTLDKAFAGGSIQFSLVGRRVGANDYRAKLVWLSANRINLQLIRNVAGTSTTLRSVVINGLTFQGNDTLRLHFTLTGTAPTTLSANVWKVGGPEPATWQATVTDTTPQLATPGSIALQTYLASAVTNAPLTRRSTT